MDRRRFLQTSVLGGGGLIIGISLTGCSKSSDKVQTRGVGGQPNAWLRIGGDESITIIIDKCEMGQGVFTALPMLIAEELDVTLAAIRVEFAPAGKEYTNTLLGAQLTGASTSVREAWTKLRTAGAQARAMLVGAAAEQWQVDAATLQLEDGAVVGTDGQRATFGQLAQAASSRTPPKSARPKDRSAYALIGKPQPRLDTPAKVDGSSVYGIDIRLPGMKYAALAQSPTLGGKALAVDSSAAAKMPGGVRIVTVGSGIAVIADHYWQACVARDALKITWDAGPNAGLNNAKILAGLKAAGGTPQSARKEGDLSAAMLTAKRQVTAAYELPLLAHAAMEPINCTADAKADGCDVYVGTQSQQFAQKSVATALGLKPEQVRIHTQMVGGSFGRRLEVDFIPAAAEASRAIGAPVQVIWSREDDMTHDLYRPPAYDVATAAFDTNNALSAFQLKLTSPSISARTFPAAVEKHVDRFAVEAAANYLYDVPNVSIEYLQHEVGIDVGYWRSVGHSLNCFVVESFMDELAHVAGKDPFEFRRSLLEKQPRAKRVLEEVASRSGWGRAAPGHHHGIAVMEGYGTYVAQVADISVVDGKMQVHKITCAVDCGQMVNPKIVESQVTSGIIYGLSAALWGEVTLANGKVRQTNFDNYRVLRLNDTPELEVHLIESSEAPGGIGEPSTAVVAPAVANALFTASGKRVRALPFASQQGLV